ncbi:MAG: hypothetical protein Q9162_001552 [Coniocarpon cinnabarinum]
MATSRIFIQGLPPTLSEEEFRAHFAKRRPVTDVKLMPKRRIGYVGYMTAEDAQSAVKYFNKSFLRMSKLLVELAYDLHSTTSQSSQNSLEKAHGKRVRATENGEPGAKLRRTPASRPDELVQNMEDGSNKPRDSTQQADTPREAHDTNTYTPSPEPSKPSGSYVEDASKLAEDQNETIKTATVHDSTDSDWMRSRTSRLLGLLDEGDEEHGPDIRNVSTQTQAAKETVGIHDERSGDQPAPRAEGLPSDTAVDEALTSFATSFQPVETSRLFLRNLAYTTSEDNLSSILKPYGELLEIQLPHDFKSGACKGFAFAEFEDTESARKAVQELDGTTFNGRLLHVLPAAAKREPKLDEFILAQMPLKKRRIIEKKRNASSSTFNWNSMFMNSDAVLSSTAARLGVAKSEVFDPTSSDGAVKQAQAETNTIQSTKNYFQRQGIDLSSFSSSDRTGKALLVKNFKYETTSEDLKKMFAENGEISVSKILMPPAGTIAIVEFANEIQAGLALRVFAYRKLWDSILFLERAPRNLFKASKSGDENTIAQEQAAGEHGLPTERNEEENALSDTSTLFVRNLNFITTSNRLWQEFQSWKGLKSALVKTRSDPRKEGQVLSMGFGFLEFGTHDDAKAALKVMDGHTLDDHVLQLRMSHKGNDAAADRRRSDMMKRQKERSSKLLVKNLPFEASRKDVRNLLRSYGQLRALRMPKKLNNTSRGYAFAQFQSPKEAENALNALGSTHLLGRRLVLQYAADDLEDPEEQIAKMQRKVGKQVESVSLQKLAANQRRKLDLDDVNEDGDG